MRSGFNKTVCLSVDISAFILHFTLYKLLAIVKLLSVKQLINITSNK